MIRRESSYGGTIAVAGFAQLYDNVLPYLGIERELDAPQLEKE